jgi:hypothetical protein
VSSLDHLSLPGFKFGVVAALLVGVLSALALMLVSGSETHPPDAQMREALERALDRYASLQSTMCGVIPRGSDRADAISCASESIATKTPFLVAFQERGEDSDVWSALSGNAQGDLRLLVLDSSPYGEPQVRAEYFVTELPCREAMFAAAGNGAVWCKDLGM